MADHRHGNKTHPGKSARDMPILRKVPADSVPYGDSISRNGRTVWAAYAPDAPKTVICAAATADEAYRKYRGIRMRAREPEHEKRGAAQDMADEKS